jgi:hypothetical protein
MQVPITDGSGIANDQVHSFVLYCSLPCSSIPLCEQQILTVRSEQALPKDSVAQVESQPCQLC